MRRKRLAVCAFLLVSGLAVGIGVPGRTLYGPAFFGGQPDQGAGDKLAAADPRFAVGGPASAQLGTTEPSASAQLGANQGAEKGEASLGETAPAGGGPSRSSIRGDGPGVSVGHPQDEFHETTAATSIVSSDEAIGPAEPGVGFRGESAKPSRSPAATNEEVSAKTGAQEPLSVSRDSDIADVWLLSQNPLSAPGGGEMGSRSVPTEVPDAGRGTDIPPLVTPGLSTVETPAPALRVEADVLPSSPEWPITGVPPRSGDPSGPEIGPRSSFPLLPIEESLPTTPKDGASSPLGVSPAQTPELGSLGLFTAGAAALSGYAVTRLRARGWPRRPR